MNEPRTFRIDLADNRHWRLFLGVLFGLTLLCRFLIHNNLQTHPVGRPEELPGTESWLTVDLAQRAVEDGDWLLAGPNILLTREMAAWMPLRQWEHLSDARLPRGAAAVYLVAVSMTLTHSLAFYTFLSLLAGAALAVTAALAGEQLFASRRAGALAGLIVACHGSLALAGVLVGPWQWETLTLATLLWLLPGLRADQPAARWLLAGLTLAIGLWLRSFFWWGVLAAVVVLWRYRPSIRLSAALMIPVVIAAGALCVRNISARAPLLGSLGMPAWDFVETTNPASIHRRELPPDSTLFEASRAQLPRAISMAVRDEDYRRSLAPNLQRKLRELLGARDETWTFNADYLRRRAEMLRTMTLPADVTMALGWAALILLLLRRGLPKALALTFGIIVLHGLLFRTAGMERGLLHLTLALATGGALAAVGEGLRQGRSWPFLFLALWAGAQWLLAVDDQARGPRLRSSEFGQAAQAYRRLGKGRLAEQEIQDYRYIQRQDKVLGEYWNAER